MFFLKLFSRLPFSVLYVFSDFLFIVSFYLVRYRRKMVVKNLRNSFPDQPDSWIKKVERDFYHRLCDYVVETLKLLSISKEELMKRMQYKNPQLPADYGLRGQSVMYLASHQFNWEWIIAAGNLWMPFQVDYVYQAQSSEFVNRFSILTRGKFGSNAIKRAEVGRDLVRNKSMVRGVAIVADQFPGHGHDKRYWTTFLHQDTAFFEGVNNLALLMKQPIFFIKINRKERGFYEMEFIKIGEPPYEKDSYHVIENYIRETEKIIYDDPAGWLWSHNRWKKSRNDP